MSIVLNIVIIRTYLLLRLILLLIKKLYYRFKAISRSNVWIGNDMKKKS